MDLISALDILSKSSPYAVSTDRKEDIKLDKYKEQIYVTTPLETAFRNKLARLGRREILFLCGSSGDGKSEVLNKYKHDYLGKIEFRLDATHSFKMHETAIQSLDRLFSEFKQRGYPLVVGINIGMLVNYADYGAEEHNDIKECLINFYQTKKCDSDHISFLDFEQFPKFSFQDRQNPSSFTQAILEQLTEKSDQNPFYKSFLDGSDEHSLLFTNFKLLSIAEVQQVIIDTLLKARLVKDQFITARSLLDFIYNLLCADGYLFDNMFCDFDNELSLQVKTLDPTQIRSEIFDQFILQFGLYTENDRFKEFDNSLQAFGIELKSPASYIRLFYLLKNVSFGNDFHHKFLSEFDGETLSKYMKIWKCHSDFTGQSDIRKRLNKFYSEVLLSAIHVYVNRNAPELGKGLFFQKSYNGIYLAADMQIKPNWSMIQQKKQQNIGYFNACLTINGNDSIEPLPININLFELLIKIIAGYRPNKHDKNTIILLDEVIEHIISSSIKSSSVCIRTKEKTYVLTQEDADYIDVGER